MNDSAQRILDCLVAVERERHQRELDAGLAARVVAVKAFQHARFARTYADLLGSPSYAQASRFFLDELYGPHDFTERDRQFERVVPALVRLFPEEIVETVSSLAELHRLSEALDTRMALAISDTRLTEADYAAAWRAVGEADLRTRQIELTLAVGSALERYTRRTWLRRSLRAMRRPAQLAGLAALQRFLESGFDTFREMPDPKYFLELIGRRERQLADALFRGNNTTNVPDS